MTTAESMMVPTTIIERERERRDDTLGEMNEC